MDRSLAHLAHQTKKTREGERDMTNRKPFRTKKMKLLAKEKARKCAAGHFVCNVPVSYHK